MHRYCNLARTTAHYLYSSSSPSSFSSFLSPCSSSSGHSALTTAHRCRAEPDMWNGVNTEPSLRATTCGMRNFHWISPSADWAYKLQCLWRRWSLFPPMQWDTNLLFTRLESRASSQKGFWQLNFCRNCMFTKSVVVIVCLFVNPRKTHPTYARFTLQNVTQFNYKVYLNKI